MSTTSSSGSSTPLSSIRDGRVDEDDRRPARSPAARRPRPARGRVGRDAPRHAAVASASRRRASYALRTGEIVAVAEEPSEDELALAPARKRRGDREENLRPPLITSDDDDRPLRGLAEPRGRRELGVLAEHRPLELLERGARLDPELLDEHLAGVAVGLERLRLPAAP